MTRYAGRLITFEGTDGAGKTTQMGLLAQALRKAGYEVVETAEPGGTETGQAIRTILLEHGKAKLSATTELLLYFAARAQNVEEVIRPALERGAIVLSDRFTDSTRAYQGAGRGLGAEVVEQLHRIACGGLDPDLTICLDVEPEQGLERRAGAGALDRMESEGLTLQRRVRAAYLQLAAAHPERIRVIDASGSVEEIQAKILEAVRPILP
jgi:dTMP kinase